MPHTYGLYLESGPRRRKTMVHVLDLLGCVVTGPTTDETVAATPDGIRAFRRFLARHGEAMDPDAPFDVAVVEHITEGMWLGNGSPYLIFRPDLEPLDDPAELERLVRRYETLREVLAAWAEGLDDGALDAAPPGGGRPARGVLLHVLGASGAYLGAAVEGGGRGHHALHTRAERAEVPLAEALRASGRMAAERVRASTPHERTAVVERASTVRTLRKALRHMLEHDWEHLAEVARRPGGPEL